MGNALFIVWRESVEAILVIGILYAWIRAGSDPRIGLRHLWAGVGAGLVLAGGLALAMLGLHSQLAGDALEAFQAAIVILAAGLITHMVLWMRAHGRRMKQQLEAGMARAAQSAGGASVVLLTAIAVGREGAETVLFLYGLGLEQSGDAMTRMFAGAGIGFVLALLTGWLIQRGAKWLPSRVFFRGTEFVLCLLAAALLVSGVERLINLEWLPPLFEPVWDSSGLLAEGNTAGDIAAAFAGYRSQPSLTVLIAWFGYWATVAWLGRRKAA